MDWQTIGHQNQKIFLENALKTKNFSHAYLFAGPAQIGKRTLALEFAAKILEAENSSRPNPDLIQYGKEQNKIEDIRNLIHELALKPYSYAYKVAVVDDFENATAEAANSILKTLEEPNSTTIIILIASNPKKLLPTILSRCQVLNFNRLSTGEMNAGAAGLAALFNGKIGKKIQFDNNPEFQEELASQGKEWQELKNKSMAGRLLTIKNFSEFESADLLRILENWLDQEHYEFVRSAPKAYKNLQLLSESLLGLRQNLNKKMVLEKLFLNLRA